MNYLIILAGGIGSRIGGDIPKQYLNINGTPIIKLTLQSVDFSLFRKIVIVAATQWQEYIKADILREYEPDIFLIAPAGESRQESILNGLLALKQYAQEDDIVVIHDAARPNCEKKLFTKLIDTCIDVDGAMPVLPVKDTVYVSSNGGQSITGLLNRNELFIGQSPEAYKFGHYLLINQQLNKEELAVIRGSSEIAYKNGLKIKLIEGDEMNFKISTPVDLERFIEIIRRK